MVEIVRTLRAWSWMAVASSFLGMACVAGDDVEDATFRAAPNGPPNILVILADDLGYSDIGAFGGEIATPNLDALAARGRILTNHHSGFTCSPSRAMLLTGADHHLVGFGRMGPGTGPQAGQPGYEGYLNDRALSVAEILRDHGYHTYMAGKWHLGSGDDQTPVQHGFESSYVLVDGFSTHFVQPGQTRQYRENGQYVTPPADFYSTAFYTDRIIADIEARRGDGAPFYAYLAYTAPHWPLQVPAEDLDRYRGVYDAGYEVIRAGRLARQRSLGLIPQSATGAALLPASRAPTWDQLTASERAFEARRMEIYAAMVENLDRHIGRLVDYLRDIGEYDRTFIWFQSDNGPESTHRDRATADNRLENLGNPSSYVGLGLRWAEVSATPFRLFKGYSAEGGHAVPAIVALPRQRRAWRSFTGLTHLVDLAPTFLELAGIPIPGTTYEGRTVHPMTGHSLLPVLRGQQATVRSETDVLADEQNNHRYVVRGRWKLLWLGPPYNLSPANWELYDLAVDRSETQDVAAEHPDVVAALIDEWNAYVEENGVILLPGNAAGGR